MADEPIAELPRRETFLFSDRQAVMDAIDNPASVLPRKALGDWQEHHAHWQARAVLATMSAKGLLAFEYEA